ncbi:DUF4097 family beta strand repeat-containing protein [Adlercreutzia sp. R25]|nr:DUF4097 family beta strand repeat-containing protein [Adlercreutzia sp. R25]MEC4272999.1 DUF4097 family beta strand repeat-containing protein [Adlercreutzia sp. R25]
MKLATSTYIKVALIVVLCLAVCSWLGGCGRSIWPGSLFVPGGVIGCMGVDAVGDVADEVRQGIAERGAVATTDEGSHFEIAASEVNALELNWLAGRGTVLVVPDAETGGKVLVDEVVNGGRAPAMVCETGGGVLSISYMEGGGGLSGCSSLSMASKDVTVKVPASLAEHLALFELEAASGHYEVEGLTCDDLELGVASGKVNATAMAAQRASLNVASGSVSVQGSVAEHLEVEIASGTTTLSLGEGAPAEASGSLASGKLVLEVPANTRLATNIDKTSGSFNNELANGGAGSAEDDAPACSLDFDILSGNFTVKPVA